MKAIISDIHGNLAAFQAVLEDIARQGVKDVICLGDIIGYGPQPKECLDIAMGFQLVLVGNHESALMKDWEAGNFNSRARQAIEWTRAQLDILGEDAEANRKRWDFLGELAETYEEDGVLFVHGSPRDNYSEYIYPRDIYNPNKLHEIFDMFESMCFVGHTHVPGIFFEEIEFKAPEMLDNVYHLDGRKVIVNVGSVGQPRDLDPRACYVTFDGETVFFHRVEYNVEDTIQKMQEIPELDEFLSDRLREGR